MLTVPLLLQSLTGRLHVRMGQLIHTVARTFRRLHPRDPQLGTYRPQLIVLVTNNAGDQHQHIRATDQRLKISDPISLRCRYPLQMRQTKSPLDSFSRTRAHDATHHRHP
ncbi:MAG: hypothetical protein ACK559_21005, partial [bacterium]